MNREQETQHITVRPATSEDAEAIATILITVDWLAQTASQPFEESKLTVARHLALCAADNSHSVYVAENAKGDVTGYISIHWLPYLCAEQPEGYISELFVLDYQRGQGIGSRLLDTVVEESRRRGCSRLMLVSERGREVYNREFYKKRGWEERPGVANFVYWLLQEPRNYL